MRTESPIPDGLWKVKMFHRRSGVHPYFFTNRFFWMGWWLSDQVNTFKRLGVKHHRWGVFSFFDRDYLPQQRTTLWDEVVILADKFWPNREVKDIYVLTSPRILGYAFNPISFFFIQFSTGTLECLIQVCNTYREIYHYPSQGEIGGGFEFTWDKNLYVSPFITLQSQFYFKLNIPRMDQPFHVTVKTIESPSQKILLMAGASAVFYPLSYWSLRWMSLRFPLHPLMTIILIHWHALKLWMRQVPYFKKTDQENLQKGVKTWKAS